MSNVSTPVAVVISDLHIDKKPTIFRSDEGNWFGTIAKYFKEIRDVSSKLGVPVICAGDIFHRWNADAETINFLLDQLPQRMLSIAGNHDLPNHQIEDIKKSAYWTLVRSEAIHHLDNILPYYFKAGSYDVGLFGYSYGVEVKWPKHIPNMKKIAILHKYTWMDGHCFPGAPKWQRADAVVHHFKEFDFVVTGDNHKSFLFPHKTCSLYNPGSMLRLTSDQRNHRPEYAILRICESDEGSFISADRKWFACASDDILLPEVDERFIAEAQVHFKDFICSLSIRANNNMIDYKEALKEYIAVNSIDPLVEGIIKACLHN